MNPKLQKSTQSQSGVKMPKIEVPHIGLIFFEKSPKIMNKCHKKFKAQLQILNT